MFTKVAKYLNRGLYRICDLSAAMGMFALVVVMVVVVVAVFARWLFNVQIRGTWEIVTLCFAVIVWGPMAMAAIKGQHIALTLITDRLPRLPRLGLEIAIDLVSGGVFGLLCWRLVEHGIQLGLVFSRSALLKIPYAPFVYFAAAAVALMALAFLTKIPVTIGKMREEH